MSKDTFAPRRNLKTRLRFTDEDSNDLGETTAKSEFAFLHFEYKTKLRFKDFLVVQGACQRFALAAGGRDEIKLREQKKPEAWKMLENAAESHLSAARFVRQPA